ncbi:hypothetical protein O9992_10415 [Vibrio lentus]|nr:hypothetical protein [Vibrio lentus]
MDGRSRFPATSSTPYAVYNIGHGSPISLMDFVEAVEDDWVLKRRKTSVKCNLVMYTKPTLTHKTCLQQRIYTPKVTVKEGVAEFIHWYREFYNKLEFQISSP